MWNMLRSLCGAALVVGTVVASISSSSTTSNSDRHYLLNREMLKNGAAAGHLLSRHAFERSLQHHYEHRHQADHELEQQAKSISNSNSNSNNKSRYLKGSRARKLEGEDFSAAEYDVSEDLPFGTAAITQAPSFHPSKVGTITQAPSEAGTTTSTTTTATTTAPSAEGTTVNDNGSGGDDDEYSPFYVAEPLDYFKKEMDPELFEWVNPDEIQPGATTCGFLKPRLGSLETTEYPLVSVYVCMHFASIQPAPKGNMFVHCGGPGSLSNCVDILMGSYINEEMLDNYNILSIDQRGMGRSYPTFATEECIAGEVVRAENDTIIDFIPPPEWNMTLDPFDVENVKSRLEPYKRRIRNCWTCMDCDFFLNATQPDGTIKNFHFLEYSGTMQLVEDMFRIRQLLNAPTLHLYGISYGTTVMSTYATIFPSYTGLFVVDSNASPIPDQYHVARTDAIGTNDRIDYIIFSCSARRATNITACPVEDMRKCIGDISGVLAAQGINPGQDASVYLLGFILILFTNVNRAVEICETAADGDADGLESLFLELYPFEDVDPAASVEKRQGDDYDPYSQPTDDTYVPGFPDYPFLSGFMTFNVNAMDLAGHLYDDDRFAREIAEIATNYPGAGTGIPANRFFITRGNGFYWPKAVPLPPAGNPEITGMVIGMLYDPNTPYSWTQEMRAAFQYTHLLTSQALVHGLGAADSDCQRHVHDYFRNGYADFVDGTVCGADFADTDTLASTFVSGAFGGLGI